MNLLYVWNEAYFGAKENTGYLLSSRYQITFARQEKRLFICRRESLSEGNFWGEHIYDVMAVVGNNGAGKTQLAYCVMETLDEASSLIGATSDPRLTRSPFLLVFEDNRGGESEIKIFAARLELSVDTILRYNLHPSWGDLKRFKFAYFTDTLALLDYEREKYGVVCDNSLGGGIRKTYNRNWEMHYIDGTTSPIIKYFDDEMWEVLGFVCSNQEKAGIPFVPPKVVTFSPKRYQTNLEYIANELKGMGKPGGKEILEKKCNEIQQTYGENVRSALTIHLMLNVFKASCIPQISLDHLQEQAEKYLEEIGRLECRDETAFDMILRLLEQLRPIDDRDIIPPYIEMVLWLKKQSALQNLREWETWRVNLSEEQWTVEELYRHYCETRFPYPYLSISFGLSTGEYVLLRRFARINELLDHHSDGRSYVTNNLGNTVECDGLMLYFDEADQSMHPEWQRKQLDWLLQFVSARFKTCASQLVVATHSPIVLSEIPCEHVLYLRNSGDGTQVEQREIRTFGSNIHTLFRDAFFLSNGTMGAFAERKINEIAQSLQESEEEVPPDILSIVEEIGDDVIRNKLRQMCRIRPSSKGRQMDRQTAEQTIHLLRNQVKHLEAVIQELENMQYD